MENQNIGPFFVYEKLGSHRRHQVYQAKQVEQDRDVAIKFIKVPSNLPRESVLQKIQIESDLLKELSHPHLVKFYGAGVEGERIFLASKLVKGESLATLLGRRSRLAPDMVIDYAKQIASCLAYIHDKKLIHSKLTPDKILIDRRAVVRLIDVRINRPRKRRWDAPRRHQMEIAAYMAPEVLTGKGSTAKSDFYSLGVIMYEMLTGELPFEPDTLGRMVRRKKQDPISPIIENSLNCPVWLEQIVMSLLEPNPKMRPNSAEEIVNALKEIKALAKQKRSSFFQRIVSEEETDCQGTEQRKTIGFLKNWLQEGEDQPWTQRLPLRSLALLLLIGAMIVGGLIATSPPSSESLFTQAEELGRSSEIKKLRRAELLYTTLLDREEESSFDAKAYEAREKLQRRMLVLAAENGTTIAPSSTQRAFQRAFQAEREGEFENAIQRYRHLSQTTDSSGPDRHVHLESLARMNALEDKVAVIEQKTFRIDQKIRAARMAITNNDFALARKILNSIIVEYSMDSDLRWAVEKARSELRKLDS